MKAWMSSSFGQISSLTIGLAALEHRKNIVYPVSYAILFRYFNLADNQNWHNILSVWIYS